MKIIRLKTTDKNELNSALLNAGFKCNEEANELFHESAIKYEIGEMSREVSEEVFEKIEGYHCDLLVSDDFDLSALTQFIIEPVTPNHTFAGY